MAEMQQSLAMRDGRRLRILLVDDIAMVRKLYGTILRREGYEVAEAGDGTEALQLLAGGMPDPDLLLTDYQMPGFDGAQLALRMRQQRPGLPVLLISGSPEHIVRAEHVLPFATCLLKPTDPDELAVSVAQILARSPSPAI